MGAIWGIHNDKFSLDLIEGGYVSIGWDDLGDLTTIGPDRQRLKELLAATFPDAKPGAIPVWAGILTRFMGEMRIGDVVISPDRADRTLNFGVVDSDFYVDLDAEIHRNRRKVKWTKIGVPRNEFSQSALFEIGSALTLFKVKNHSDEFQAFLANGEIIVPGTSNGESLVLVEDEPNADRVDSYSRDFVIDILRHMDAYRFEHFVAGLLRAIGYRASATVASGDGGVDVIASRDPLALEPPIIKAQCKRTIATIGAPEVQKLAGALATGGVELGLFVTLGAYSNDALHIERTRHDLRLINGTQLVDLIFDNYEALDSEWKRLLPLRRVYAVDRNSEGT